MNDDRTMIDRRKKMRDHRRNIATTSQERLKNDCGMSPFGLFLWSVTCRRNPGCLNQIFQNLRIGRIVPGIEDQFVL
jgi:hypothetical protein